MTRWRFRYRFSPDCFPRSICTHILSAPSFTAAACCFMPEQEFFLPIALFPFLRQVLRECSLEIRLAGFCCGGTVLGLVSDPNRHAESFQVFGFIRTSLCALREFSLATSWLTRRGWLGTGLCRSSVALRCTVLL